MDRGDLPETVRLSDGRLEPFEPERISRRLFAAAERIGQPDAFLARELTESVLHFLSTENMGPVTTPDQIAEVTGKVVRELGRPALARAFEDGATLEQSVSASILAAPDRVPAPPFLDPQKTPWSVERVLAQRMIRNASLTQLFPRDLASAHAEGLIEIAGLEHPLEMEGLVISSRAGGSFEAIRDGRMICGGFLAIDGPEYELSTWPGDPDTLAEAYLREVQRDAELFGLQIVLNLNIATPPPRLAEPTGPLFAQVDSISADRRRAIAAALATRGGDLNATIWWHLGGDPPCPELIGRLPVGRRRLEFVFDRPRVPIALGPGVDRATPAALVRVGLNLARLVDMVGGPPVDPEVFLRKIGSLTRFAKTAGHVKQDILRRSGRPAIREAFLLDRARIVFVPMGLDVASRAADAMPTDFAREILRTIRAAAENDRPRTIPIRVDAPLGPANWFAMRDQEGTVRQQVRNASQLHAATGAGRLDLEWPANGRIDVTTVLEILRITSESSVARLQFVEID